MNMFSIFFTDYISGSRHIFLSKRITVQYTVDQIQWVTSEWYNWYNLFLGLLLLLSCLSRVQLCAASQTAAHQAPQPWDSPGKNTGVGCHFLLQCVKVKVKLLSHVQLLVTPWTAAHQASPSMGFSRQEYWSGLPLPSLFLGLYGIIYEIFEYVCLFPQQFYFFEFILQKYYRSLQLYISICERMISTESFVMVKMRIT